MLKTIIERRIDAGAKDLDGSMDYIKFILRTSLPAFRRFAKIFAIANYRGVLPADAYHVARIVAARDEDCGACVQIEVNLARKRGVPPAVLQAVIASKPDALPVQLALVYRFVDAVVRSTGEEDALRTKVVSYYGEKGLVEIALAVGASRFLPITKRTLGYATACSLVSVEV